MSRFSTHWRLEIQEIGSFKRDGASCFFFAFQIFLFCSADVVWNKVLFFFAGGGEGSKGRPHLYPQKTQKIPSIPKGRYIHIFEYEFYATASNIIFPPKADRTARDILSSHHIMLRTINQEQDDRLLSFLTTEKCIGLPK